MRAVCPLQCRLRRAADDDRVDWAGLPVNLDWAFSPQQRDKVYAQHLMRKRGTALRRLQDRGQRCACEFAADGRRVSPGDADSMSDR
ncbi:hypothetical protein [Mycobacterium sp. SMC-2]|uniref:hypothetical protein n=1 Tax=Mycobacterium sp. SMC-2 TaxID=2857058 RepID=UPI0028C44674|nr:hypothetical protein [Mycobacterium sp. SMC-2]